MERDGWLIAVIGCVVLVGLMLLALFTVGLLDPEAQADPFAVTQEPAIEVRLDPGRAFAGVGVAVLLIVAAIWVIKRNDWSIED